MTIKGFQTEILITELSDVDVSGSPGISTGDALIYNALTTKFEHQPTPIFTGLDALPDVTLSGHGSPVITHIEKEILSYNADTSQWVDRRIPDAGLLACSTGLMTGGKLQIGTLDGTEGGSPVGSPLTTSTTITVTAGEGVIVNSYTDPTDPTYTNVAWSEFTDVTLTNLAGQNRTFFAINNVGTLLQQGTEFTAEEHRDIIHIGTAGHVSRTHIVAVRSNPHAAFDPTVRLGDLAEAIGAFNVTGNVYGPNATDLTVEKDDGESYRLGNNFHTSKKSPDITQDVAELLGISFNYSYQDGGGTNYILTSSTTLVDPANYDDGTGILNSMPANDWQVQIIKHFPGGAGHRIEYGQTTYGTAAAAISAIPDVDHIHNPGFAEGITRSYLVVRGGASNLSITADAHFIEAGRFGASGAAGSTGSGVFSSAFESSPLPIAASANHLVAHGLGVRPSGMQAFLRCTAGEFGYSIGDEVEFLNGGGGSPATTTYKGLYADADNIAWFTGPELVITNLNDGSIANVTLASWDIILRAYA